MSLKIKTDSVFKDIYQRDINNEVITLKVKDFSNIVESIKLVKIRPQGAVVKMPNALLLTIQNKDKTKAHYLIAEQKHIGQQVDETFNDLMKKLPIDKLERAMIKVQRETIQPEPPEYWEKWDEPEITKGYYEKISDPMLAKIFAKEILEKLNGKDSLTIVDVGGGKGRLAEKLIDLAQKSNIKVKNILIEPSPSQCNIAKATLLKKLGSAESFEVINAKIEDFTQPIQNAELQKQYDTFVGKADVVISSGGPLSVNSSCFNVAGAT